jgi:hypothetical protein
MARRCAGTADLDAMETNAHSMLKRLALAHLRTEGYAASACEVRSPIARWVVDVAGWRDYQPARSADPLTSSAERVRLPHPQTVVVECKQSRSDFLRDSRRLDALLTLRERLLRIRCSIEEHRIKTLEPQLRRTGTSLFPELDEWDFSSSRLPAYQRTLERLERVDDRLYGQTKFFRLARYAMADQLYVAAPRGLISLRELPAGWGLLECDPKCLTRSDKDRCPLFDEPDRISVRFAAPVNNCHPERRHRLLRNIATAACSRLHQALT